MQEHGDPAGRSVWATRNSLVRDLRKATFLNLGCFLEMLLRLSDVALTCLQSVLDAGHSEELLLRIEKSYM